MNLARVLSTASACVALGAAGAACSGSFGSGSGLPTTLSSAPPGTVAASPTPSSTSTILTYGDSVDFQSLAEIGGYSASVAFPKAAEPTRAPQAAGKGKSDATPAPAPTPVSIAVGATLSIVKPEDGPDLNFESGKGRHKHSREHPARALAYITLLPTHDMTLASYPRIALDIPRETASQYRDGEFGLALWNSGEKDSKYRLAVAELDTTSTPPPLLERAIETAVSPEPVKTMSVKHAVATPPGSPNPLASPSTTPEPNVTAAPSAAPTLPPARIVFAGTATTLKLVANRPAVFALYALPHPAAGTTAPSSASKPSTTATGAPSPAATKTP